MAESDLQSRQTPQTSNHPVGRGQFATTQWSVIRAAGNRSTSVSREALQKLCRSYWYPLYAFVRRRGYSAERAEDLTQAFFTHLIQHGTIGKISPTGGRFRSFLLKAATNFLNNEHKYEKAQKRGGNVVLQSIDFADGDRQYAIEPVHEITADLMFERQWAVAALTEARLRLAEEYADQPDWFAEFEPFISVDQSDERYREIADRLQISLSALKTAIHRIRKRFRTSLRSVIAETVGSAEDVDEEISYLMKVFKK